MADWLAIDWESTQICGLAADGRPGGPLTVRRLIHWPIPAEDGSATPEQVATWLRQRLDAAQISRAQVLVSLPREAVVVRLLEVPEAGDDELPELVKYQVAARSTQPIDELALDYVLLPPRPPEPGAGGNGETADGDAAGVTREVLAVTAPRTVVEHIRRTCELANLEPAVLTITPFAATWMIRDHLGAIATSEKSRRQQPADAPARNRVALAIGHTASRLELWVLEGTHVIQTHSTALPSGPDAARALFAEITRTVVSLQRTRHGLKLGHVWLLGETAQTEPIARTLQQRLRNSAFAEEHCPVELLDPLRFPSATLIWKLDDAAELGEHDSGILGAAVGLLIATAHRRPIELDLWHPHRPPVRRAKWPWVAGAAAAAALVGLIALHWHRAHLIQQRQAQLQAERENAEQTRRMLQRLEPRVNAVHAVQQWQDQDPDWLFRLHQLTELQQAHRLYFTDASGASATRGNEVRLQGRGRAADDEDVYGFYTDLADLPGWSVSPHEIPRTNEDERFPYTFDLDVRIAPTAGRTQPDRAAPQNSTASEDGAAPQPPPNRDRSAARDQTAR